MHFSLLLCTPLLKPGVHILLALLPGLTAIAQTKPFRDNGKWGLTVDSRVAIPAQYDTLFAGDSTGGTCLACYRTLTASANKFIKMYTKSYHCNYLNAAGQHLSLKTADGDTCSVFSLGKHTASQFSASSRYFVAAVKNQKYLVDRNFRQITFGNYSDMTFCADPNLVVARVSSDGITQYAGLINLKEQVILPFQYTDIAVNLQDSLIMACSGQIRQGAGDDVFDYHGKKTGTYRRHVELATHNFIIHKLYEPKETYVVYDLQTKEERNLDGEAIRPHGENEILVQQRNEWFIYDMKTGEKRPVKQH